MNKIILATATLGISFFLFACKGDSGMKTADIKVYGNCEQCEDRIESALHDKSIAVADWNPDTKLLHLEFDSTKISMEQIHQIIAASGHDTEMKQATDSSYKELPECCQYERHKPSGLNLKTKNHETSYNINSELCYTTKK